MNKKVKAVGKNNLKQIQMRAYSFVLTSWSWS